MSKARNGNGRIAKYNRQVADKAGLNKGDLLPYAPDFLDSLVRRMAIPVPGEIAERCLAWLIYRANGNQDLKAIHLYSRNGEPPVETELWQTDCALELAWVEAGHRVEWLDAPRAMFRAEADRRGVKPIDKSRVSEGFQFNRIRGTMEASAGYSLVYVPSPNAESFSDVRETCRRKGEDVLNKTTLFKWASLSYARELREYEVAHATEQRLLRFLTAAYKKANGSLASETNGAPSLEALETLETLEAAHSPVPAPPPAVSSSNDNSPADRPVEWHAELQTYLDTLPIGTALDEPMFRRIASHLSAELLPQFKTESEKAKHEIRKWAGYEAKAKQVKARGLVKAAAAGGESPPEDPLLKRFQEDQERRKAWATN
jgi:hypothetical protein